MYTGAVMSTVSLLVLIKIFFSNTFHMQSIKQSISILLSYGSQRLPADFGLASLIALPAIFSAHTDGIIVAGYVAFSISLLNLSGQAVAPIGLIMLPKIGHLLGEKNFIMIRYYVKRLFVFSALVAIVGTLTYQLFTKEILQLYLGNANLDLIAISKNIMWAALFYPFYVTMRSVVDAYYARAYNTISILVSLTVFLILYLITNNTYSSLLLALATLSIMTLCFIKPILKRTQK